MVGIAAGVGLVTSVVMCAAAIAILRRLGVVDVPNPRSSHAQPTVRGVGIGVALASLAGFLTAGSMVDTTWPWRTAWILAIASVSAGAVGLVDDLFSGISVWVRLAAQVVVASGAVVGAGAGEVDSPWRVVLLGVAVLGFVGHVNAFNFMDGINGISSVSAIIAGCMFAIVGVLERMPLLQAGGAALAAASLGFLPFNFPRARAFLGDVGSYFLGAWIILLAYAAALAGVNLETVVAPLALYLADVGFTLVMRICRGKQWHTAHRDHVYQRLSAGGLGHTGTTLIVLTTSVAISALGLAALQAPAWRVLSMSLMAFLLITYLALPFLLRYSHIIQAPGSQ